MALRGAAPRAARRAGRRAAGARSRLRSGCWGRDPAPTAWRRPRHGVRPLPGDSRPCPSAPGPVRARPGDPARGQHNVPDWRAAVGEVRRVLRPGGWFFFEDVTSHALGRWSYRTFLDHPSRGRFSAGGLVAELERHGITVDGRVVERFFGDFVIGVGAAVGPDVRSGWADAPAGVAPAPDGAAASEGSRVAPGGDA